MSPHIGAPISIPTGHQPLRVDGVEPPHPSPLSSPTGVLTTVWRWDQASLAASPCGIPTFQPHWGAHIGVGMGLTPLTALPSSPSPRCGAKTHVGMGLSPPHRRCPHLEAQ